MMADPLLAVRGLAKSYGPRRVLDAVSFAVRPGEVLGLIGPNGAGKSTLFECLAGLQPADSGSVTHADGQAVHTVDTLFFLPDGIAPWPAQSLSWALDFVLGYFGGRRDSRPEVIEQ